MLVNMATSMPSSLSEALSLPSSCWCLRTSINHCGILMVRWELNLTTALTLADHSALKHSVPTAPHGPVKKGEAAMAALALSEVKATAATQQKKIERQEHCPSGQNARSSL